MNLAPFNEIEEKYNLLDADIDGYHFWVYGREDVAWNYEKGCGNLNSAHAQKKESAWDLLKVRWQQLRNIVTNGRLPVKECDLLIMDHPRRVLVGDFFECIYTDDIAQNVANTVVLEESYQHIHYQPTKTKNLVYTDWVEWKSFWYCVVQKNLFPAGFTRVEKEILRKLQKPIEDLNQIYGTKLSPCQFIGAMVYGFYMYQVEKKYYSRIIRKLKPKAIVEVVSYNRRCMIVNEIGHELGIPTIELQHGTAGEEHSAYNYPPGHLIRQFPEYFFMFSEYWDRNTRFPIPKENRRAVGYPYLEKMAERYADLRREKREKKNILFLSSGPIGNMLSEAALGLADRLNGDQYHIIFKLHPGEYAVWRERYPRLEDPRIEVIDNNRINLYELYSISDIQVSGYTSTTVFEGLYFDLQTYILDYRVSKEIAGLCQGGIAHYFKTAQDLARQIEARQNEELRSNLELWKKEGLKNTLRELNEIMGRQDEGNGEKHVIG